ncbi:MAG TPA: hypothetical protein VFK13_00405 [Gemmatimonadaceae bacterium]|nr:hypothetical protein [Gemmatimonadaceae bacterium]
MHTRSLLAWKSPRRTLHAAVRSRWALTSALVWTALAAGGGACTNRARGATIVADSTLAATMADLYAVNGNRALDSATRAEERQRVLDAHGVTLESLEATARALGEQPERAARVWARMDSLVRGLVPADAEPAAERGRSPDARAPHPRAPTAGTPDTGAANGRPVVH